MLYYFIQIEALNLSVHLSPKLWFCLLQNRKNDEASYEKMLKLRRDLNRACTILDMVKRREQSKKELLQLTVEVFEKRYEAQFIFKSINRAIPPSRTLHSDSIFKL